jgi:hypothetical protein
MMHRNLPVVFLTAIQILSAVHSFGVPTEIVVPASKRVLLENLDRPSSLNTPSRERTALVKALTVENSMESPGSTKSFSPVTAGTWSVVYAPHISTMGQGNLNPILYDLRQDGTIFSHARFHIPVIDKTGWLSVSGTYSSQDENRVSRVDFDKAWIKWNNDNDNDAIIDNNNNNNCDKPYPTLDAVPASWEKSFIQTVGRLLFIDSVSVFPVSYLDEDTIVFDFELLGTRICARKIPLDTTAAIAAADYDYSLLWSK